MTALAAALVKEYEITDKPSLPLAGSQKVWQNGLACWDTSTGALKKGASGNANLIPIGTFLESTDNSANTGTTNVVVQLDRQILITYWANDTVSAVSGLYSTAYILDDQTVTASASGNSVAGRVWKIDAIKGIGVVTPAY